MRVLKIFLYHLLVFVFGSIGIGIYFYFKMINLAGVAGLGAIIVAPTMFFIAVLVFGVLCLISFLICFLVSFSYIK
jgi:hypothetical protein